MGGVELEPGTLPWTQSGHRRLGQAPWTGPRMPGPDSGKVVAERAGGSGWESFMKELAVEVGLE